MDARWTPPDVLLSACPDRTAPAGIAQLDQARIRFCSLDRWPSAPQTLIGWLVGEGKRGSVYSGGKSLTSFDGDFVCGSLWGGICVLPDVYFRVSL
jgi:hypothetical protein